jgi:glycosyltransferase involved in cell wall biosynthesis
VVSAAAFKLMRVVAHNGARILGGAERATVLLLSGLQARGHDVLLMCNDGKVAEYCASAGIPSKIGIIGGDLSLLYARRFASSLNSEKPDAVIVGTWKKLFFASWAAKKAGARKVVARVGLESDTARSFKYRYALRRWTDAVVVNANQMAASFSNVDGFDSRNVSVIQNGVVVPQRQSPSGALRAGLGIPACAPTIGTVARLAKQKRIDRLLRAFAKLPRDVHCIIAGDGSERESLARLAAELGVSDRVHLIGHREDKGDVLDALDLFVVTSDQEGLSNAMLEAMAFGLPIVSTPVSGAGEALLPDIKGTAPGLITSFDDASIAASIETLLADSANCRSMGEAAKRIAVTRFSLDSMLDQWEEILTAPRG